MQFKNQTILITGGTSGIGRALVDILLQQNNQLIIIGRNPHKLDELQAIYPGIRTYTCSLDAPEHLEDLIVNIQQDWNDIAVIINNAAMQYNKKMTDRDFDLDSIQQEINLNLVTPIKMCAYFLPYLLKHGRPSTIINISSGLALFPKVSSAVYSATKAGLHNFSQALGYQTEKTSIKVVDVILPLVDTPMTQGRGKKKLSAVVAAQQILQGVESGKTAIYPGKSRWIPLISRISPSLMARIMKSNS